MGGVRYGRDGGCSYRLVGGLISARPEKKSIFRIILAHFCRMHNWQLDSITWVLRKSQSGVVDDRGGGGGGRRLVH